MTGRPSFERDRAMLMPMLCGLLLAGCAPPTESSSLAPTLGHSQPSPTSANDDDARPAEPGEPSPSEPNVVPLDPTPTEPTPSEPTPTEPAPAEDQPPAVMPPAQATEVEDELCRHITTVVLSESKRETPLTVDQIDELIASCSLALAQDRRELGEAEFRRRAQCVRAAATTAGFSACQPRDGDSPESR